MSASVVAGTRDFQKLFKQAVILGAFAVGGSLMGLGLGKKVFFSAYLQAFTLCMSVTLGCLGLTLLHNLVGGLWGESLRKYWATGIKTIPFMAVLFLPILAGVKDIYEWAGPEAAHDPKLIAKAAYLNVGFFAIRSVLYFAIWFVLGYLLRKNDAAGKRPQGLSGFGVVLFILTCSFASFDWLMSLEPHWFSSIYGALFISGSLTTTLSFLIILVRLYPGVLGKHPDIQLHDLGKLLFMSVMLWAYLSFSQYLIIWSAQLPEELQWYASRSSGGWQFIGMLLIACHFVLPFLLLLSRSLKKNIKLVSKIAMFLLVVRAIDLWWLVFPSVSPGKLDIKFVSALLPLGLAALWFAIYLKLLPASVTAAALQPAPASPAGKVGDKVEHVEPQDR